MSVVDSGKVMQICMLDKIMTIECIHPSVERDESQERHDGKLDAIEGNEIEHLAEHWRA